MGQVLSCQAKRDKTELRTFSVVVPEGVEEGDQLKFTTVAGPYALRLPAGVSPGRKLEVTIAVSVDLAKEELVPLRMTVNGQPLPGHDASGVQTDPSVESALATAEPTLLQQMKGIAGE